MPYKAGTTVLERVLKVLLISEGLLEALNLLILWIVADDSLPIARDA